MSVSLYMDVHVPQAISEQLRRRGVDVLTAQDAGSDEFEDDAVLEHARGLDRVLFTQDIRFKALAEQWQAQGRSFAGLIFGHQLGGSVGQFVRSLELVAKASDSQEWLNTIEYIPF